LENVAWSHKAYPARILQTGVSLTDNVIEVKGLRKVYKKSIIAVAGISFEVKQNEIFGLLGPNGAGKSTVMKVLTTLISSTAGDISIHGLKRTAQDGKIREIIGYVPQDISADSTLTGYENVLLSAKLHYLKGEEIGKQINKVLKELGIYEAKDRLTNTYSGGMIRKLEFAQAMVHTPSTMFLDEPTVGLDPYARNAIWEYIKKWKQSMNITIVLSTHYMEEADELCDRIAIMSRGKIVALGTPEELKRSVGKSLVVLEVSGHKKVRIQGAKIIGNSVSIPSDEPDEDLPRYINMLYKKGIIVTSAMVKSPTLDDVFIKYTGKSMQEKGNEWGAAIKARRVAKRVG
jgi:ABC-2 type transport system ATP-binding protein